MPLRLGQEVQVLPRGRALTGELSTWGTPARVPVELVELRRADGHALDALWYAGADPAVGLLHVHGKGSSMLSSPGRFLPPMLPGVCHLALNMRCHDLAYTVGTDDYAVEGGMWEDLVTGHLDLAAGVAHLRERGVQHVVVCGHSSGGFYAADLMPREADVAAWILLSPLTSNANPFTWWWPDPADRARAEERARAMVAAGQGRELVPVTGWFHAISAASLVQRFDEPDDLWLTNLGHRRSPVLLLWGDAEPRDRAWTELFDRLARPGDRKVVLPGTGHYYRGQEGDVARAVGEFLDEVVPGGRTTG